MELVKKLSLVFLELCIVFSLFGLAYIVYALNGKLDVYTVKNDKYSGNVQIAYNGGIASFKLDKDNNSVQKFITCYEEPIKIDQFPGELKSKIDELYELFSNPDHTLSFSYEDLYTGLHVSYDEDETMFAASTIKAPVMIYLYEQVDEDKIDLNSEIVYTPNYYLEGSGSIQYSEFGKGYSIRELASKAIIESDNIAYQMISYNLDKNEIVSYWNKLGSENFWEGTVWSNGNSKEGVIYMKELYRYYLTDTVNSKELMNYFYNSVLPLVKSSKESPIAHKSGWRATLVHDTALVLDEYPYVVSIMTDLGNDNYREFFDKASSLIEEFHNTYWDNKSSYCYKQSF